MGQLSSSKKWSPELAAAVEAAMGVLGAVFHGLALWAADVLLPQQVHEYGPAGAFAAQVQRGAVLFHLALLSPKHGLAFTCLANVAAGAVGRHQALLGLNKLGPAGTVEAQV